MPCRVWPGSEEDLTTRHVSLTKERKYGRYVSKVQLLMVVTEVGRAKRWQEAMIGHWHS